MPRRPLMIAGPELRGAVVLVVHAHPDDEVFATGAATIAAQAAGAQVHLRVFTGGEGRASGTTFAGLTAARQRKEARLAASIRLLGIDDWAYLTQPGRWTDTPHVSEWTIAAADVDELATPAAEAIELVRPDILLTVGPDGLTGHPDHIACHGAVRRALAVAGHAPAWAIGAVLDQRAAQAGAEAAATSLRQPVGTGNVTGAHLDQATLTIAGPQGTESRRRHALDAYIPGPGTSAASGLDTDRIGTGDSALLRFVLDAQGWDRDHYLRLA